MKTKISRVLPPPLARPALLLLLVLGVGAAESRAQSAAGSPSWSDPSFLIESIDIVAQRVPISPLRTELRLEEGRSYSESELRRAVFRVKRLPFVLDARMSLARGSERGRYRLTIAIVETSRFFLVADTTLGYRTGDSFTASLPPLPGAPDVDRTFTFERESTFELRIDELAIGARHFFGRNGVGFVSANDLGVGVGYTQYNLFGSRSFATLAVRHSCCDDDASLRDSDLGVRLPAELEASLAIGAPLARNHSLQLNLTWADDDAEGPLEHQGLGLDLRWFYDTTDDPFFPTRGWRASAAAGYFETDLNRFFFDGFFSSRSTDSTTVSSSFLHYFPRPGGESFWLGLGLHAIDEDGIGLDRIPVSGPGGPVFERAFDYRAERRRATASAGWARPLLAPRGDRRQELRLEASLDVSLFDDSAPTDGLIGETRSSPETLLAIGVAYRNRWSVVRFGVSYRDGGEL